MDFNQLVQLLEETNNNALELQFITITTTSPCVGLIYSQDFAFFQSVGISTAPSIPVCSDRFEVCPLPNKGSGVVATSAIPKYTPVLQTQPLMFFPGFLNLSTHSETFARHLVSMLPPYLQNQFLALGNSHGADDGDYFGRILTNGFVIKLPPSCPSGEEYYFLFPPPLSSINHSCSPNATWAFEPLTFTQRVTTVRPISEGEEICFSYLDESIPSRQRSEIIDAKWGFKCDCWGCSPSQTERGNASRRELTALEASFCRKEQAKGDLDVLVACSRALEILETEKIWNCRRKWAERLWKEMSSRFPEDSKLRSAAWDELSTLYRIESSSSLPFSCSPSRRKGFFPPQVYERTFNAYLASQTNVPSTFPLITLLHEISVGGIPVILFGIYFSRDHHCLALTPLRVDSEGMIKLLAQSLKGRERKPSVLVASLGQNRRDFGIYALRPVCRLLTPQPKHASMTESWHTSKEEIVFETQSYHMLRL